MGHWKLRVAMLGLGLLAVMPGCADSNPQGDPWTQGSTLESERSRTTEQSAELRNRLITGQNPASASAVGIAMVARIKAA